MDLGTISHAWLCLSSRHSMGVRSLWFFAGPQVRQMVAQWETGMELERLKRECLWEVLWDRLCSLEHDWRTAGEGWSHQDLERSTGCVCFGCTVAAFEQNTSNEGDTWKKTFHNNPICIWEMQWHTIYDHWTVMIDNTILHILI